MLAAAVGKHRPMRVHAGVHVRWAMAGGGRIARLLYGPVPKSPGAPFRGATDNSNYHAARQALGNEVRPNALSASISDELWQPATIVPIKWLQWADHARHLSMSNALGPTSAGLLTLRS